MSIKVRELYSYLEELMPRTLSCEWDNDGLMVCADDRKEVKKILFALDVTYDAVEYAHNNGFDVIISHHPLIFTPLKSVSGDDVSSAIAIYAIKNDVAVMSFHTRFDSHENGVNDVLSELLELNDTERFGPEGEEIGIIGNVQKTELEAFALKVKSLLCADSVNVTASAEQVKRVAVLGGGGKDYVLPAYRAGADTFVTGEINYNTAVTAKDLGINVIEAGHYFTEAAALKRLEEWIKSRFAGLTFEYYNSNPSKIM